MRRPSSVLRAHAANAAAPRGMSSSTGQRRWSAADNASNVDVDRGNLAPLPSSSVTNRGSTKKSSTDTAIDPAVASSSG